MPQVLLWSKYQYYKRGIPAHLWRKENLQDMMDNLEIDNALAVKEDREIKVKSIMAKGM